MSKQPSCQVSEILPPLTVSDEKGQHEIRMFRLSLNETTVEVCSLGAAITKILLPDGGGGYDDVVLGFKTPVDMFESGNPVYFGVIVGRVANRIQRGSLKLDGQEYQLAVNNGPNHLHGGDQGFSRRLWDLEIVEISPGVQGVKCTLISSDGDQNYPGSVKITAVYSLVPPESGCDNSAVLRLTLKAQLQGDKPTPINLAQHSYFNLSKHNDPRGVLDHRVQLACNAYTPVDATSIPTREVRSLDEDPIMDLRPGKLLRDALQAMGVAKGGLSEDEASKHVTAIARRGVDLALCAPNSSGAVEPYGYDHNYVVPTSMHKQTGLRLVGTVEHAASHRRMSVYTDAPGCQMYTSNYCDGLTPDPKYCKEGAAYSQWQGVCLETQHYPDSILSPEDQAEFPEYAKGQCFILRPGAQDYEHNVDYHFETTSKRWKPLHGIVTPLVTPLLGQDSIDSDSTKRLIDHVIAGGVSGIFLLGSTGEGVSLSYAARRQYITFCCDYVRHDKGLGDFPVLVGVTDTAWTETVRLAEFAYQSGATAVVVSTPYYFSLDQPELLRYMKQLLAALPSDLAVVLYNIPFLAKNTWAVSTVQTLVQKYPERVVGIKDSGGDMEYFRQLCSIKRDIQPDFTVMMGPEILLQEAVEAGADGGVSGGSNVEPRLMVSLYEAAVANGNDKQTKDLMEGVSALQQIYDVGSSSDNPFSRFIVGTKSALVCKGVLAGAKSNEPFVEFDSVGMGKIQTILDGLSKFT